MSIEDLRDAWLVWGCLPRGEAIAPGNGTVLVPEHRPYLYGIRHNVPRLKEQGLPFVCCTDNMIGHLLYRGKIARTVVYYKDRAKGRFVCPGGTLYVVLLSRLHGVAVEFREGRYDTEAADRDAATLGGKRFVGGEDAGRVLETRDETLPGERDGSRHG